MSVRFVFNHLDPSHSVMTYTEQKLSQLFHKYLNRPPVAVRVSFSRLKNNHVAHCDFQGPYGTKGHAEDRAASVYGAVNKMATRLAHQLKRQKDRLKAHKSEPIHVTAEKAEAKFEAQNA